MARLSLAVFSAEVTMKQTAQAPSVGSDGQRAQKETALRSEWDWDHTQARDWGGREPTRPDHAGVS